jgi:uncharacterized Zn finger protein (UPF0148 family)
MEKILTQKESSNLSALRDRYSGPFFQPVDGTRVHCPLHGTLGKTTFGGELFCPVCALWYKSTDAPLAGTRLEQKQQALRARQSRQSRTSKNGSVSH